jgi:hypothetical protein
MLYLGSNLTPEVIFTQRPAGSAAAFDHDSPFASFMIESDVFTLTGTSLGQTQYYAAGPKAALASPEEGRFFSGIDYFSSGSCAQWAELQQWEAATLVPRDTLYHEGSLAPGNAIGSGDFDGDQVDELITHGDFGMRFIQVFGDPCMRSPGLETSAHTHAVGDHDGDGDDELALGLTAQVAIFDGE